MERLNLRRLYRIMSRASDSFHITKPTFSKKGLTPISTESPTMGALDMIGDKIYQPLLDKEDPSEGCLGIGIVTYNRPAPLLRCIQKVLTHTKRAYELVVADDGSEPETAEAIAPFADRLSYLRCENRGVNFNKNRLLYYFSHVKRCNVILIIEDDSFPTVDGWEEAWVASTKKYGHINNAGWWFKDSFVSGSGSAEDPYLSPNISAQCAGFSREAIERVGFIDPKFENYGGAHTEHSYRMVRAGYGGEFSRDINGLGIPKFYLINGKVDVIHEGTGYPQGDEAGLRQYFELRDGPIYRSAWRDDAERQKLWDELAGINDGQIVPSAQTRPEVPDGTLDRIGVKYGTDKNSTPLNHDFLSFYESTLYKFKDDKFTLLEVGIYHGESLVTWGEYFPNATVVGADIDPNVSVPVRLKNVNIRIGDASRLEFLDELITEFGEPLIAIDDGSHFWHHQIETFKYLWPRVKAGGLYIMEDIHTSFPLYAKRSDYRGMSTISGYDFLIKMNKWVVGNRAMDGEIPDDGFIGNYWPTIRSIHFYRGTCLIHKQPHYAIRGPFETS